MRRRWRFGKNLERLFRAIFGDKFQPIALKVLIEKYIKDFFAHGRKNLLKF
jgi:hypothetical protein